MLRVCLLGLIAGGHSGVPRYAAMLARALDRVSAEFPELRLTLLTSRRGAAAVGARRIEVRVPRGPLGRVSAGPARVVLEQLLAARSDGDLLHFFDLSGPLLAPSRPFVATVHDASAAHGFRRYRYAYKRRLHPWALRSARAVVAVSAFARDEAVLRFGADPAAIRVVRSGPGLEALAGAEKPPTTDGPYLLYVGNLGGNKNLDFLIAAFERAGVSARLVLVGRRERFGSLRSAIAASSARDRIRVLDGVPDEEVDRLYRGALALVLPSRYEGFGFPPLEAMARGCPVLASDIPPLREVSGSGAMLLPLDDLGAWSEAIRRVVEDERLRAELRERGAAAVARYSWDETARRICALFCSLAGEARRA